MGKKDVNFDDVKSYDITKANSDLVKKKQSIQDYFMSPACKKHLVESLPKVGITADRMVRLLFTAIQQNQKLANCTPQSLFSVIIQCASMGLEPNTALGHAYIIPYGNKATLIFGYKGLIELCRRSDKLVSVEAMEVYPADIFDIQWGTDRFIRHVPNHDIEYEDTDLIGAYCVAWYKSGENQFEYMPKYKIERMRARSKSKDSGPWVTDYAMMSRKTAIRRLMHYLPLTNQMAEAIRIDEENELGAGSSNESPNVEPEKSEPIKRKEQPKAKSRRDKEDVKENEKEKAKPKLSEFEQILKSFGNFGITNNEVCAYFGVDDIQELDVNEGILDLRNIITSIEGGHDPQEFKKEAARRYEERIKGK